MNSPVPTKRDRTTATLLFISVSVLSVPAAFYGLVSLFPGSMPRWVDRGLPNIPILSDVIAIAWFVVLFGGRYFLMAAFLLNLFLIFRREISFGSDCWPRLSSSSESSVFFLSSPKREMCGTDSEAPRSRPTRKRRKVAGPWIAMWTSSAQG
jgi:hypothetical protein